MLLITPQTKASSIYDTDYIRALFHEMSYSYDRMNYIASFGLSYILRRQFLRKLVLNKKQPAILDLMSGMGETWAPLKAKFPESKLTAMDFCEAMTLKAKKHNHTHFNNSVHILQQDALNSDLPDSSFDAIVCCFGLKTLNGEQISKLATEVKRLLKPGGQFSFIEISVPKNRLIKSLYRFYLKYIIPLCGRIFGKPREYRMLWEYTSRFGNTEQAATIFRSIGLLAGKEKYFFGCASGISGAKE